MRDALGECNLAEVSQFITGFDKTRGHYHPDEINFLKDVVSIPELSTAHVLNKTLKMNAEKIQVNNKNTGKMREICSKLTIKTPKRPQ